MVFFIIMFDFTTVFVINIFCLNLSLFVHNCESLQIANFSLFFVSAAGVLFDCAQVKSFFCRVRSVHALHLDSIKGLSYIRPPINM